MRKCYLMCRGIKILALLLLFTASSISSMLAPATVRRISASKMKKRVPASKRLIGMPQPRISASKRLIGMAAPNQPIKSNVITYGSVVRLRHKATGWYFAATTTQEKTESPWYDRLTKVSWRVNASGQNALYLVNNRDGGNDSSTLFTIKHLHNLPLTWKDMELYGPVRDYDLITLQNVKTREFIHSHGGHKSSSSKQQEVTMYGSRDDNDKWQIHIINRDNPFLKNDEEVRLEHYLTNNSYLHSHPGHWFKENTKQEATVYGGGSDDINHTIVIELVSSVANHPSQTIKEKYIQTKADSGFIRYNTFMNIFHLATLGSYRQPSMLDVILKGLEIFQPQYTLDGLSPKKQGIHLDNNLFLGHFNPMCDQRGYSLCFFQNHDDEASTDNVKYGDRVKIVWPYSGPLDMYKSLIFHSFKYMSVTAAEETIRPSSEEIEAGIFTLVPIIEGLTNDDEVTQCDVFKIKVENLHGLNLNEFLFLKAFVTGFGLVRNKLGSFFSVKNVNPQVHLDRLGQREFKDAKSSIKSLLGEASLKDLEEKMEQQRESAKKAAENRIEKTIKSLERKIKQSTEKLRKARIRSKSRTVKKSKPAIRKNKAEIRKETINLERLEKQLEKVIKKQVEDKKQKIIGLSEGAKKAITEIGTAYKAEQEIYARKGMPAGFLTPSRYEGVIARQVVFGQPIRTLRKSRRSKKKRYIVNVPALTLESNKAGKGKKLVLYFKGRRTVIYKGTKKIIDKITIGQDGIVYGFVGSNLYRLSRSVPQLLKTTAKNAAKKKSSKRRRTRRRKSRRRSKRSKKRLSRKRSRRTRRSRIK